MLNSHLVNKLIIDTAQ